MSNHIKKNRFPAALFLAGFCMIAAVSIVLCGVYYYGEARDRVASELDRARTSAGLLVEASAGMAALCHAGKDYAALDRLFKMKFLPMGVVEAFFVLEDGTIASHAGGEASSGTGLKAERASLLLPLKRKEKTVSFGDCKTGIAAPFGEFETKIIADYIYPPVGKSGWLASLAVWADEETVGTVNLVLGKQTLYSALAAVRDQGLWMAGIGLALAVLLSLAFSLLAMARYGRAGTLVESAPAISGSRIAPVNEPAGREEDDFIVQELDSGDEDGDHVPVDPAGPVRKQRIIKDGIPIK